MATILDVARLAGVSQGTVSNVLNGKGNVSSEKIRVVEEAAQQLGYTINERARILRKGTGKVVGVILPTVESRQYREFYYSLKYYVESNGYSTELFLTNNSPQVELEMIQRRMFTSKLDLQRFVLLKDILVSKPIILDLIINLLVSRWQKKY